MSTVVCCTVKTDRRAQSIKKELRRLGYDECFEERVHKQELLLSLRVHFPCEEPVVVETLERAGAQDISTWLEAA